MCIRGPSKLFLLHWILAKWWHGIKHYSNRMRQSRPQPILQNLKCLGWFVLSWVMMSITCCHPCCIITGWYIHICSVAAVFSPEWVTCGRVLSVICILLVSSHQSKLSATSAITYSSLQTFQISHSKMKKINGIGGDSSNDSSKAAPGWKFNFWWFLICRITKLQSFKDILKMETVFNNVESIFQLSISADYYIDCYFQNARRLRVFVPSW